MGKSQRGNLRLNYYSRINPNTHGGWGHEISKRIEERACRNSRGQLKKKGNLSWGISMGLGFWPWSFQVVSNNFAEFPGVGVKLVFSGINSPNGLGI